MAVNKHPDKLPPGTRLTYYLSSQNFLLGGRGPSVRGKQISSPSPPSPGRVLSRSARQHEGFLALLGEGLWHQGSISEGILRPVCPHEQLHSGSNQVTAQCLGERKP